MIAQLLEIVGATAVVVGLVLLSVPAAWIAGGLFLVLKAYELDRRSP